MVLNRLIKRLESIGARVGSTQYESITLPDELRGNVANYDEHVYRSPIKTSAGDIHFTSARDPIDNYFAHSYRGFGNK